MANLIINPQNTSGDKVIIQDQAGGEVLTTADSGATLESNVTGSPAITGFGTVTSGTLGSAVTFPTGHVLQAVIGSNLAASTGTNVAHTSSSSSWPTIVSGVITPSVATSLRRGRHSVECHLFTFRVESGDVALPSEKPSREGF